MRRIAYIINSVEGGGAALPVPAVAQVIRDNGAAVEVFALTRRDGRAIEAMNRAGLPVHVRPGGETDHLAALFWLVRRLAVAKPDIIWTSLTRATLLGQAAGARLGLPVVSWQHAAFLKPMNKRLLRAGRKRSILWVADSHCVADFAGKELLVPPERLAVWPLFSADPTAPAARPWAPGEPLRVGTLGRLHPVKGYDVLLAAFARLRAEGFHPPAPLELTIAGEGEERARLQGLIDAHGLDFVRMPGFVETPRDLLASLHLYVQPSRSEGLCIAAHEAMQAGLPTIVSRVGELAYSVEEAVTGALVPPGDAERLAAALASALSDPRRLGEMGAAARLRVFDRFGAEAFAGAGRAVMARLPDLSADQTGGRGRSARRRAMFPVA